MAIYLRKQLEKIIFQTKDTSIFLFIGKYCKMKIYIIPKYFFLLNYVSSTIKNRNM